LRCRSTCCRRGCAERVGYNLSLDGEVTLVFTPMVAAVVGDTEGVASA